MKKEKVTKKILYLDYACNPGDRVYWTNYKKERFEGILLKMDENFLASVELKDGTIVTYQC
jgi:hypothetical protein